MVKRTKKKKKFSAATAVKSAARNVIGSPKPTRRDELKPHNSQEKHKPTLGTLLSQDE